MLNQANHVAEQAADKTHWTAGNRGGGGTPGSSDRGERGRKSPAPMQKRWACPIFVAILSLGAAQAAAATAPAPQRKPRQLGTLKGTVLYVAPDFDAIPEGFEEYVE